MRRSSETHWLVEDGKLMGILMQADFCAEHEWGIESILKAFGIEEDSKKFGIRRRKITKIPPSLGVFEHGKTTALAMRLYEFDDYQQNLPSDLRLLSGEKLSSAWSERHFGIIAKGKEDRQHLQTLVDAINQKNAAIFVGGGQSWLNRGGLVIAIVDAVKPEYLKKMEETDREADRLQKASDKTGIIDRLREAKRGYYACSPRFKNDNEKSTKYDVVYFLNPQDQHKNNFGWFSVEDLDDWIAGKGPIPKT